jgi:hypothetical protein
MAVRGAIQSNRSNSSRVPIGLWKHRGGLAQAGYPASFVSKMTDADGEAGEVLVWLDFAFKCGYLLEPDHAALRQNYDHICAQLVTMINQAEKWCGE